VGVAAVATAAVAAAVAVGVAVVATAVVVVATAVVAVVAAAVVAAATAAAGIAKNKRDSFESKGPGKSGPFFYFCRRAQKIKSAIPEAKRKIAGKVVCWVTADSERGTPPPV